jgi:hypothetical protein
MVQLESSGLLERLGYEVPAATPERIFSSPDSVMKAKRAADGGR